MDKLFEYIRNYYKTHRVYRDLFEKLEILSESEKFKQYWSQLKKPVSPLDPTKALKAWVDPSLESKLTEIDKESETVEGQQEILNKAKKGDHLAATFLYVNYLGLICDCFRKYILYPLSARNNEKIDEVLLNDITIDVATTAMEMLTGNTPGASEGRKANVFNTFKAEVYTNKGKNFNLLNHFGFYFKQYFTDECYYLLRKYANQGMTGIANNSFGPRQISYDAMIDALNHNTDEHVNSKDALSLSYSDDLDKNIIVHDAIKTFKTYLSTKPNGDLLRAIFDYRQTGLKPADIAQKLGIDVYTFNKHWKNITNWFKAQNPEIRDLYYNN